MVRRKKTAYKFIACKKGAAILVTMTVLLLSITSCGKNENSENTDQEYEITVGDGGTVILIDPMIPLAEEKGYFEDYGLTVNHQQLENVGTVLFDALSIGKIDALYQHIVPAISYGAQYYDVTLFAGTLSGGMVAVCLPENQEELSDISNWKGHSIGVIQLSTSELVVRNALKEYGIDGNNDVTFTMIEDQSSIALGTAKGNVDIGFVLSDYVEQAVDAGCVVLTTLYDIEKDYVCCRQSAYSESISTNRQAYVYYLQGQIKAYKDIYNDQETTVENLAEKTGESEDYVYSYIYDSDSNGKRTYNLDPNYNGVEKIYAVMLEENYLESDLTLDQFFDLSIYADALKAVILENPTDSFYQDMKEYFLENNNEYPDFDTIYGDEFWED